MIGDIGLDADGLKALAAQLVHSGLKLVGIARDQNDRCPGPRNALGGGPSDAPAGAGDYRNLSL